MDNQEPSVCLIYSKPRRLELPPDERAAAWGKIICAVALGLLVLSIAVCAALGKL